MKKLISFIFVAFVAIILLALVVVPVINDSTNNVNVIKYNGNSEYTPRMSFGTPTDNLKFVKPADKLEVQCYLGDNTDPYYVVPLNTIGQLGWVFVSSSFSLGITGWAPQPLDTTSKYGDNGAGGFINADAPMTLSVNVTTGKIITWGDDPNNSWDYYDHCDTQHIFWADPNGDYVNTNVPGKYSKAYIENPKNIAGSSMTQGNYIFYYDTDHLVTTNSKPAVVTTETTDLSNGLYELTKVPMTITGTDNQEYHATSEHVIVKYKVQGTPTPGGDGFSNIAWAIPTMLLLALILGAAMLIVRSKE